MSDLTGVLYIYFLVTGQVAENATFQTNVFIEHVYTDLRNYIIYTVCILILYM